MLLWLILLPETYSRRVDVIDDKQQRPEKQPKYQPNKTITELLGQTRKSQRRREAAKDFCRCSCAQGEASEL